MVRNKCIRALPGLEDTAKTDTAAIISSFIEKKGLQTILDAGSGSGYFSQKLGDRIISLDIDSARLRNIPGRKINAPITDIPLKDSSLDGIIAKDIIEHVGLSDAFIFLSECERLLKNNGYLLITTLKNTQSFWDKPDHVRPYSNKWVTRVATQEMGKFRIISALDLPRGVPGAGKLHLQWLVRMLARHLTLLSDHGIVILQKI